MNCTCPHCATVFRVDPAKVPAGGVRARCSVCRGVFAVAPSEAAGETASTPASVAVASNAAAEPARPAPVPAAAASEPEPTRAAPQFGAQDPDARARRLARALISDIVVYHPERRERSLREGSIRHEFREEIRKSWEEYVAQVGEAKARSTPYFREALNEILAGGSAAF